MRERILVAAGASFAEHGFEGATFDDIADRADVARATVFNHFADKEALLRSYLARRGAWLRAHLDQAAGGDDGATSRLARVLDALARFNQDNEREARAILAAWHGMPDAYGEGAPTAAVFAELIAAGQAGGEVAPDVDCEAASFLLFDGYIGAVSRWFAAPKRERPDLHQALRDLLELTLRGIAAR